MPLSPGVPEGIMASIKAAEKDPEVRAIVLIGGGRTFIAGADIKEFGKVTSGQKPRISFNAVLEKIENSTKPVVMADFHGTYSSAAAWRRPWQGTGSRGGSHPRRWDSRR